ncbi:2OG-Fe dioxygenase family protein [Mesorhizobium sp. M1405]|uniref:2OG-Fe dioxygenase family protein n=1 Tax=unclassified Mesorhizobium TaxID=325217 RepID=UPI00333B3EE1
MAASSATLSPLNNPLSIICLKQDSDRFLQNFCETAGHDRWNIKLHPYRIVARDGVNGKPAPEGLHQDGVDFIVSHMIGRVNVTGGMSTITDASKRFLGDVEMNLPNDFVICNDRKTFHDVSSIVTENPKMPFAYRDVLVITFEKL